MRMNEMFPSPYVAAEDLNGQDVPVVIRDVVLESVKDDEGNDDHAPIMYFDGMKKGLRLNRTNAKTVAGLYGDDTAVWPGHQISIFPTQCDFKGKQVACIRVRLQPPGANGVTVAAPNPPGPLAPVQAVAVATPTVATITTTQAAPAAPAGVSF